MEQAPAKPSENAKAAGKKYIDSLEAEQQKLFKDWLERNEFGFFWSRTDKKTHNILGTPDFIIPALKLALEFKQPGGKLSSNQEIWRDRHLRYGGLFIIVNSFIEGKDCIEKTLARIGTAGQGRER